MHLEEDIKIATLYKLSKNETLFSVAKKYNLPTSVLISANKGIEIASGVTIVVPKSTNKTYKVEASDTVESICEQFGIDIEHFEKLNGDKIIYLGRVVLV